MAVRNAAGLSYYEDEEAMVASSRTAMFTHRESTALEGGAFFSRVAHRVLHKGLKPSQAIEEVLIP
jgi:ADP-ribosylglycohydrolase